MTDDERRKKQREYMKAWRIANPERAHINDVRSRMNRDKSKVTAYSRKWRAEHPERVKAWDRRKYLRRRNRIRAEKYGVPVPEIDRLMRTAACEACGIVVGEGNGCVDHDHDSGAIRGVLCKPCNYALGVMAESPARLRGLAAYAEARCVVPAVVHAIGQAILEAEGLA